MNNAQEESDLEEGQHGTEVTASASLPFGGGRTDRSPEDDLGSLRIGKRTTSSQSQSQSQAHGTLEGSQLSAGGNGEAGAHHHPYDHESSKDDFGRDSETSRDYRDSESFRARSPDQGCAGAIGIGAQNGVAESPGESSAVLCWRITVFHSGFIRDMRSMISRPPAAVLRLEAWLGRPPALLDWSRPVREIRTCEAASLSVRVNNSRVVESPNAMPEGPVGEIPR